VEGNLAVDVDTDWRREVSTRVQDYRARRRGSASVDLQSALPFDSESPAPVESSGAATMLASAAPARKMAAARAHRTERIEIAIPQLETAAVAGHARWAAPPSGAIFSPSHVYPVATLPERRRAAAVDVVLLLFSYGGMLALFTVLGGHIGFNRLDLLVAVATLALFYAQYFALFTVFGGSTPGMMLRGLRVVSFDGGTPTSRQMVWRSFGYVVSAGACFLGFLWALWDDDQLCWQDRISQTYITPVEERPQR
jgi:uncharacterized RDD family membrane protein YckC